MLDNEINSILTNYFRLMQIVQHTFMVAFGLVTLLEIILKKAILSSYLKKLIIGYNGFYKIICLLKEKTESEKENTEECSNKDENKKTYKYYINVKYIQYATNPT